MFIKTVNLASNLLLPILVWQSYWFKNSYATNILNFLIVFVFIFSVLGLIGLNYTPEDKKLEIKVARRKYYFNNKNIDVVVKCLDIGIILTLIGFGSYFNAILLILSMMFAYLYTEELQKV